MQVEHMKLQIFRLPHMTDSTGNLSAIHVYYAQQWNDFCKDINNRSSSRDKAKIARN